MGLLGFWRQQIPHLGVLLQSIYQVTRKSFLFSVGPRTGEGSATGSGCCAGCFALGTYDPAEPMVLEVSVADRDTVWSLWQAPTYQSQKRPLGHQSKALPSSSDNYSPFEKQLLAWYWALVETKCLTMGHKVTIRPNLPVTN